MAALRRARASTERFVGVEGGVGAGVKPKEIPHVSHALML